MGFGKDGRGAILYFSVEGSVGALGAQTAVALFGHAVEQDFRILKIEGTLVARDTVTGETLELWIADGDLTVAEIASALDSAGVKSDDPEGEPAYRPVFFLGATSGVVATPTIVEKSVRWTFSPPDGFTFVVYNPSTDALAAVRDVNFHLKVFGVWVR